MSATRRNAFTLIELLVVIGIITILVSLLMVGLSAVRTSYRKTDAKSEITQIDQAASIFAAKFGTHPPVHGRGSGGKFRLCTRYLDNKGNYPTDEVSPGVFKVWPEVDAMKDLFPQMNMMDNGLRHYLTGGPVSWDNPVELDGNQALFFWLMGGGEFTQYSGFAMYNPRQPFAPPTGEAQERRTGPWFRPANMLRLSDGMTIDGRYRDTWGKPYAVFGYAPFARGYQDVPCYGVLPFKDASGKYLNPKTIQVVSSGPDKTFGPGGSYTSGSGEYADGKSGFDDLSNFKQGQLGSDKD